MTSPRASAACVAVALISTGFAAVAWNNNRSACAARDAAIERARQVSADVEELLRMRNEAKPGTEDQEAASLLGPLNQTLSEAGVSLDSLTSATPETTTIDSRSGSTGLASTRITLDRLTLSQLGGFLGIWRARYPAVVPASIEITPMNTPTRPDHVRARILLVQTTAYLP